MESGREERTTQRRPVVTPIGVASNLNPNAPAPLGDDHVENGVEWFEVKCWLNCRFQKPLKDI